MLSAARERTEIVECMMACLPCMLSYFWIFTELRARAVHEIPSLYRPLADDYSSASYEAACQRWIAFTDTLCSNLSSERQERCMHIFRKCSEHELSFWRMSARPRTDL